MSFIILRISDKLLFNFVKKSIKYLFVFKLSRLTYLIYQHVVD